MLWSRHILVTFFMAIRPVECALPELSIKERGTQNLNYFTTAY
ncbi:unnamed protein product [Callosobruchus maculatus]|uniref:Uncharacterized protein n=1 Tax=Callosobruchus maculatus TaxID=64391 RepID=A0A653BJK9_CALMS|nr:unnamed protein product [Callosobruchus maculatus]